MFGYEHILYTHLLIEYVVSNTETLHNNPSALSWRLPEINTLVISDALPYLDVAQKWHNFASAVRTNIPKRRHKTSRTLDADHQGIYHHMTTKIKTGNSWFVGDSNLPPRSLGGPTAARPPGQENEVKTDLSDNSCMSVIQRQRMNGNPNSDVRCYFVALGDLSIDLLGH